MYKQSNNSQTYSEMTTTKNECVNLYRKMKMTRNRFNYSLTKKETFKIDINCLNMNLCLI